MNIQPAGPGASYAEGFQAGAEFARDVMWQLVEDECQLWDNVEALRALRSVQRAISNSPLEPRYRRLNDHHDG